jgi:hypothetical protein
VNDLGRAEPSAKLDQVVAPRKLAALTSRAPRSLERRVGGKGDPVLRQGAFLRGRSWELSAYARSTRDSRPPLGDPRDAGHIIGGAADATSRRTSVALSGIPGLRWLSPRSLWSSHGSKGSTSTRRGT